MLGAGYIVDFLERAGVTHIFGYPGANILPLYEELYSSEITHVLARHEQGAVHAAEGYAKSSGKVGVCIATSGPGAANLVTGLCDAMLDSVPLVAITGQVDISSIGHDAFQEADIMGMTIPITKHSYLVKSAGELPGVLAEAFELACSGRRGPVLVDVPRNVFFEEVCGPVLPVRPPRVRSNELSLDKMKNRIMSALNNSQRPVLLLGGGVFGEECERAALEFVEKNCVPFVYTLMGKGALDNSHFLSGGLVGVHGTRRANEMLMSSDLVIAVGTRFSERSVPFPRDFTLKRAVIHADIDVAEMSKNVCALVRAQTDSAAFLRFLASENFKPDRRAKWKTFSDKSLRVTDDLAQSFTEKAIEIISDAARSAGIRKALTDVGEHQIAAARFFSARRGGFLTSGGLGTMGFGLPALCGTLSSGEEKGILITGDGSFQMTLEELMTLKTVSGSGKIFLFDNSSLGLVRAMEQRSKSFFDIENPDFLLIGKAYGISSRKISSLEELSDSVSGILSSDRHELVVLST